MQFENRFLSADLQTTEEGKLVGYAAKFGKLSHDLGGLREIIQPGAFTRTLRENYAEIMAMVEHDKNRVLARTSNGTLTLQEDSVGLRVEIDPADTSYARDLLALVKRGDVAGMSFRFRPYPGGASMDVRTKMQTLTAVQISEVSVVVQPAYPDTEVAVRALNDEQTRHAKRRLRLALADN